MGFPLGSPPFNYLDSIVRSNRKPYEIWEFTRSTGGYAITFNNSLEEREALDSKGPRMPFAWQEAKSRALNETNLKGGKHTTNKK